MLTSSTQDKNGIWTQIVSEDFANGASGWSNNSIASTTFYGKYLGDFDSRQQNVQISKAYQVSRDAPTKIDLDFLRFDSWSNEFVRFYIDDKLIFQRGIDSYWNLSQVETASVGGIDLIFTPNADYGERGNNSYWNDQSYAVEIVVPAGRDSIKVGVSTNLDQWVGDESWGIDNVRVSQSFFSNQISPIIRGNSLYTIVDGPSWTEAEANSMKLGGHLVTVNDSQENTFLSSFFSYPDPSPTSTGLERNKTRPSHWIGATDRSDEGVWRWASGEEITFFNWLNGQPDNSSFFTASGQDYASIVYPAADWLPGSHSTEIGKWDDISELERHINGIAETPFIRRGDSAYVIVQGPTWEEAEANAVKLGGHLVTINDAEENEWIHSTFKITGIDHNRFLWAGLTDQVSEGNWRWISGEPTSYVNWGINEGVSEPNGGTGSPFMHLGRYPLKWNDAQTNQGGIVGGIAEIKLAPNNAPTGTPTLSGTFKPGQVITIDKTPIQDADNFTGYTPDYKYTWEVSSNGTSWAPLTSTDATDNNTTYTLTSAEVGKQVRGVVSYLDGHGTVERTVSPAQDISVGGNTDKFSLLIPFNNSKDDASRYAHAVSSSGGIQFRNDSAWFNGIDAKLTISDHPSLDFTGDFIIRFDFYWDSSDDNNGVCLLDKRSVSLGPGGWSFRLGEGNLSWEGKTSVEAYPHDNYYKSFPVKRDQWHTVTLIRQEGKIQLLLDGHSIVSGFNDSTNYTNDYILAIGNNAFGFSDGFSRNYFKGGLDNLVIINGPLDLYGSNPTGIPTLSGTFKAGQVITIDRTPIQDADNFTRYTPDFKYSWEVSTNGTTWTPLTTTDATDNNTTYTLTTAEVGKQIRGVVSYLDGYGTQESVASAKSTLITSSAPGIQSLTLSAPIRPAIRSGVSTTSALTYNVSTGEKNLTGIDAYLYYDSTQLTVSTAGDPFQTGLIGKNTIADTNDADSDPKTDKILALTYADFGGNFPGSGVTLPLTLANLNLVPANTYTGATLHLKAANPATGFTATGADLTLGYNAAPVVNSTLPALTTNRASAFSYTFRSDLFSDPDSTLTFSATTATGAALPSWLTFNPATRTLSGTPTTGGTLNLNLSASDELGSVSTPLNIKIREVQQLSSTSAPIRYQRNKDLTIPINYRTTDGSSSTGLAFRVHFNSNLFSFDPTTGVSNKAIADLFQVGAVQLDTADSDNDPTTNQFIPINIVSFSGQFPGATAPAKLVDLTFRAADKGIDPITGLRDSLINFSETEAAQGYGFSGTSASLKPLSFSLDVDGDGKITALGDGLMVIRKFFGSAFDGDALTNKAVSPTATRTTSQIHAYIQDGISGGLLDVDQDGKTTALGDGLMIIRHLFGAAFTGDALTAKALSPTSPYFGDTNASSLVAANIESLRSIVI